jgi:hypothetical protein
MPFVLHCTFITEKEKSIFEELKQYYKTILWEEIGDCFVSFRCTITRSIFEKALRQKCPYIHVVYTHHKPQKR